MRSALQHPATLVAAVALLEPVASAGLEESAADLLTVAALDLLAEQARTAGHPELAMRRAMESASIRHVLAGVVDPELVEACLAALQQRDLDVLAAHLCIPAPRQAPARAATPAPARLAG